MILPSVVRSGSDAQQRLRPAVGHAEAGHHFVEDQQRAVLVGHLPQRLAELGRRRDAAHVADDRLDDHAGDLRAVLGKGVFDGLRRRCSAARACRATAPSVTPGELGTPSVAAELPAATSRLSTWP